MTTDIYQRQEWLAATEKLRHNGHQFAELYNELDGCECPQCALKDHNDIMKRGHVIRTSVENITRSIDGMRGASDMVFGEDVTDQVSNLGFIPLIPIAVIAGGIGATSYWIKDALAHRRKLKEIERLEKKGYTPDEAYRLAHSRTGLMAYFSNPLVLASSALLLFILFKKR